MVQYTDELKEEIRSANDIVDVISQYVTLKRSGRNFFGLCPFHNEKSPSFSVSPDRQIFKCFGCGKAGSAVTFVMEHEQMRYVEALKYLGNKYGIEVKDMESAHRAVKAIYDMGPKNVIITLGSEGSLLYDGMMAMRVEALKVEAVDTTAAGDTYNGVLASVIAEGKSLIEAVREANVAAAISVTRMGAQPAAPTREEIAEMKKRK